MTPKQWDSLRTRNEWTHENAAVFFGVSKRTSIRWSAGDRIPFAVDIIVALMERHKHTPGATTRIVEAWITNEEKTQ